MKGVACFLGLLALSGGCVLEDRPVDPFDGGVEAGPCGVCPVDQPICNEDMHCVQCTTDMHEYCDDRMLLCNTQTSQCAACLSNANCTTAAAARCDTEMSECVKCNDNVQCGEIDGLPRDSNVCEEGLCVDCTADLEAETCPEGKSCNPKTRQCTDTDVGSLDVCEECVADSECGDDGVPSDAFRCVPMYYDGNRFPDEDTGFCLKTTAGGCEQPFSITLVDRPSLSEAAVQTNYCGINENLVTCPAVKALLDNQRCPNGTLEECPEPSGLCERVGDLENRCTYRCASVIECLPNLPAGRPGSTCGSSGSGGDDYCGG